MIKDKKSAIVLMRLLFIACFVQILPTFSSPSLAKKPDHHKSRASQAYNNYPSNSLDYIAGLSYTQQANLIDVLRGRNQTDFVLSPGIRIEINNQVNSLPPGIRKRLAKGKGLPPGIAKQIELPKTLNRHLEMSPEVKIIVIGSSVAVINPLDNLILDILHDIF
jgi:hypothetical protein